VKRGRGSGRFPCLRSGSIDQSLQGSPANERERQGADSASILQFPPRTGRTGRDRAAARGQGPAGRGSRVKSVSSWPAGSGICCGSWGLCLSRFQSEPSPAGVPGEILHLAWSPPCSPRVTIHLSIASTPIKVLAATDLPLTVDQYATVRVSWVCSRS